MKFSALFTSDKYNFTSPMFILKNPIDERISQKKLNFGRNLQFGLKFQFSIIVPSKFDNKKAVEECFDLFQPNKNDFKDLAMNHQVRIKHVLFNFETKYMSFSQFSSITTLLISSLTFGPQK